MVLVFCLDLTSSIYTSPPAFFSWDNIHFWQRRWPHHIQVASQWETKHEDRQADRWLQYLPERWYPCQDWQCSWSGGLSHAAHSKLSHTSCLSHICLVVSQLPFVWFSYYCTFTIWCAWCVLQVTWHNTKWSVYVRLIGESSTASHSKVQQKDMVKKVARKKHLKSSFRPKRLGIYYCHILLAFIPWLAAII